MFSERKNTGSSLNILKNNDFSKINSNCIIDKSVEKLVSYIFKTLRIVILCGAHKNIKK